MADKNYRIFLKGEDKTYCVRKYRFVGNKCQVIFDDGKHFIYNAFNVRIDTSALNSSQSHDCFKYLKRIAAEIGLRAEAEPGIIINILANSYAKIKFVSFVSSERILSEFLNGKLSEFHPVPVFAILLYTNIV